MTNPDIHSCDKFKNKDLSSLTKELLEREYKIPFESYRGDNKVKPDLIGKSTKEGDNPILVKIGRNKLSKNIIAEVFNECEMRPDFSTLARCG
jgi:hypothetical protein